MKNYTHNNSGYTLLFAVLVSAVVLAIGTSILSISKKEFLLATSARESTTAFYAADSGLECAMYHDDGEFSGAVGVGAVITCGFTQVSTSPVDILPLEGKYSYAFEIKLNNTSCAKVRVNKYPSVSNVNQTETEIISRGYNLGWDENTNTCSNPSPRRVERALRVTY